MIGCKEAVMYLRRIVMTALDRLLFTLKIKLKNLQSLNLASTLIAAEL